MILMRPKVVFIGGGHSHAILLRLWGLNPLKNVDLSLITNVENTPYSGMIPGYLAGFYSFAESHINLRHLAQFAQIKYIQDQAIALDLKQQQVHCLEQGSFSYDYLCIDIGSSPQLAAIPGIEWAIPAKPIPVLLAAWEKLVNQVELNPAKPIHLMIIGGGVGGVELALNMRSRLLNILQQAGQSTQNLSISLIHRGDRLLNNHSANASRWLTQLLQKKEINLYLNDRLQAITKRADLSYEITTQTVLSFMTQGVFWVTQAASADWIKTSGLQTDQNGFILVDSTLRSLSHPQVFATGDIATMINQVRPKAGVFAVRQGKPLFVNLQRTIKGQKLKAYYPQSSYLSLIGTGEKEAIAVWNNLVWQSSWLWYWKDSIDRAFMSQFQNLLD